MHNQYLKSHIFVCPSSIENSPNSLGEAQILGVPCIASYVGGTPDMVTHKETGFLYRFEEFEMLAQYMKFIFQNNKVIDDLSINEIKKASLRHDRDTNCDNLIKIYSDILKNKIL